ncbi:UPF0001 protein [Smittium culicis]|uniref:UPF0001 protein n=1 Tax=Smittium culicis TaxID=133412 RepID=A0A1R1XXE1_9FUNG|nr:UPF0001 protein [Smittium culicis]
MDTSLITDPARVEEISTKINEVLEAVKNKGTKQARLVLASKTRPVSDLIAALKTGQIHFGENYIPNEIRWHYFGRLQSNKCKILANIPNLWAVETIDSAEKAKKMNDAWSAAGHGRPLNIFVQVNTSSEPIKLKDEVSKVLGFELELSMGMTIDYEHALEVGATSIRVGEKIFGPRNPRLYD